MIPRLSAAATATSASTSAAATSASTPTTATFRTHALTARAPAAALLPRFTATLTSSKSTVASSPLNTIACGRAGSGSVPRALLCTLPAAELARTTLGKILSPLFCTAPEGIP